MLISTWEIIILCLDLHICQRVKVINLMVIVQNSQGQCLLYFFLFALSTCCTAMNLPPIPPQKVQRCKGSFMFKEILNCSWRTAQFNHSWVRFCLGNNTNQTFASTPVKDSDMFSSHLNPSVLYQQKQDFCPNGQKDSMSRYGYTHIHSHTRKRTYSQLQNLLHVNAEVHAKIKREGKLMSLKAARALSVHRQRTWSRRVSASSAPPPWDGGYDCSLLPKRVTLWNKKMTMTLHRARLQHKKQPVLFIYFYVQATTTDGPLGEVWRCNQLATCRTEDVDVMPFRAS